MDICKIVYYKIVNVSKSTYMLYKYDSKKGYQFLPHGNKGTHKLRMSIKQEKSNVQSLIGLTTNTMLHQMKGIGNGWKDMQCLLLESWKNL